MGDLAGTLQRNRVLTSQDKERAAREKLDAEMMAMRRQEQVDTRDFRQREQTSREGAAAGVAEYHKQMLAAKSDDQKFQIFTDMIKAGAETPESLAAMSKAMTEKLGVQVTLQMPERKAFDTREGHNLALAEKYRERANAARRNGAGDEAERFQAIADRLERGGTAEADPMAEISEEVGDLDPLTGKGAATVRRKVPSADLDREMQRLKGTGGGAPAPALPPSAGSPAGQSPSAGPGQFETVGQAREAGKKAGDIILLFDPASKKYRRFQLE